MTRSFSSHFLASSVEGPPLRVGLIVDGLRIGSASASIVRDLVAASFLRIELLIVDRARAGGAATSFGRLRADGGLSFAAYATLDRRRVGDRDDPDEPEDIGAMVEGIPVVLAEGDADGSSARADELAERVRDASLDVLVHLGSRAIRGALLGVSRHGVWALRQVDGKPWQGAAAGFRELVDGAPVYTVALARLAADEEAAAAPGGVGLILDRATFAIDPTSLSRSRRTAAYGSTHLVVRNLRLLHERGWDHMLARRPASEAEGAPRARVGAPSSLDVLRWFVPLAVRRVGARIARTVTRANPVLHWRVAIRIGHETGLPDRPDDLDGFRWLESPRGHYYADPFLVEREGRRWLFVEDFDYASGLGSIACAELGPAGETGALREVLRTGGHLSYPLVVDEDGEARMVPESSAEGIVRLFGTTAFPDGWSAVADLLPEAAVDTTLWRQDARWWLFTTIAEPRGGAPMLMLYSAGALAGPWTPHPLNPISQDTRTSRGAGNLFVDGGRLIRPSQDGSRNYGYAVTFCQISVLSPTDYSEEPLATATPEPIPGLLGLHTYNRLGDVELIDGKVARQRRTVA